MTAPTSGRMEREDPTRIYDDTTALVVGEDRKVVAYVPADDTMEIEDGAIVESLSAEQKANADEIVRRWNAHEDLLAACEAMLASAHPHPLDHRAMFKAWALGRAAIAKAKP